MKILITTDTYIYQTSGATNSIVALKNELRKLGHDARVLSLSPNNKSFEKDDDYFIASSPALIYPGARISLRTHSKIIKDIISWRPDIVHLQSEFSSRILANKIIHTLKIPFIYTCHALYEDYTQYFCPSKKLGRAIIKHASNKYYSSSSALVVPSKKLEKVEKDYGIKCPIEVIPTGIDLTKYQRKLTAKDKKQILSELKLPDTNKCLVAVSRLAKEKNIDELLDYLPNLLSRDDKIKLIFVGDGPYRKKLENKVAKMRLQKSVVFTGMIPSDQVYKYYQLGIFVCASTSETQGLTYVEALASGVPMVCREDACLEGVITDSENGFIYRNEEDFSDSIIKIINNPTLAKEMGKKSFEKSTAFGKEEFGKRIEKLYRKVLTTYYN